jgi:hypothetical protein
VLIDPHIDPSLRDAGVSPAELKRVVHEEGGI